MDVRNCRSCGKIFNYIGGMPICPSCQSELEARFGQVKEYIQTNPNASIPEIAEANDVTVMQIEKWIREERLVFADDSPIGIECENCGANIKSGRFCPKCKDTVANGFNSLYKTEPKLDPKKDARDRARMRFLDN